MASAMTVVDCLLPNSIIVPLSCKNDILLSELKGKLNDNSFLDPYNLFLLISVKLFQEAKKYPLYASLKKPNEYLFVGVTTDYDKEEYWDENKRFCDLRLFSPLLKLIEPKGTLEEKSMDYSISMLNFTFFFFIILEYFNYRCFNW